MANKKIIDEKLYCSFCGKPESQTRRLIAGPEGVYICDECVEICAGIVEEMYHEEESGAILRIGINFREETEPQDHHALVGP